MARVRLPQDRRDWLLTIGIACVAAGFVMIALGWNGAAGKDSIQEQFPYVLSGGLGGLGLLLIGAALIVLQSFRRDHDRVSSELAELRETLARTVTAAVAAAEETMEVEASSRREPAADRGLEPEPLDDHLVIAGKASYHRIDCRLAQGREEDPIDRAEAEAMGLRPCRVCDP